jgi:hypothetical protein
MSVWRTQLHESRAQSSRGSRKAGEDSEDQLSAGDLEHDDEE